MKIIISGSNPPHSRCLVLLPLALALALIYGCLLVGAQENPAKLDGGHENHGDNCPMNHPKQQDGAEQAGNKLELGPADASRLAGVQKQTRRKRQTGSITNLMSGGPDSGANNPLAQLGELSSQMDRLNAPLKMINQLFGQQQQQQQQQQPPQSFEQSIPAAINKAAGQQQQSPFGGGQLFSSLTELIRPARDNSNLQQVSQQAYQQGAGAAQNAQGGIAAALTEIGQGLQRIASNNPSLVPDVKSLYSSVSSKLSSASQSVAQAAQPTSANIVPAQNSQQLADNLAKLTFPGVQTPA